MAYGNGFGTSTEFEALSENSETEEKVVNTDGTEDVVTLEGEDLVEVYGAKFMSPEEAEQAAAEARARQRPIDYRYIEQMKKDGVTEELAVKAFLGRFGGNEGETKFFLNSDFYYGSDAPTPLDRLKKAVAEGTMSECIEMLEGTKQGLDYGDHF